MQNAELRESNVKGFILSPLNKVSSSKDVAVDGIPLIEEMSRSDKGVMAKP